MRKTALVLWAAFCLISVVADLGALADHPEVYYLWICLALDAGTVPLCAWLYDRPPLRIRLRQLAGRS
jgi:hypothetical protein